MNVLIRSVVVAWVLASLSAIPCLQGKDKDAGDFLILDTIVKHGSAGNHTRIYGMNKDTGEYVVIVPSLGRGVEDYTEKYKSTITTRLAEAGYRVVLIQPRGVGKSTGDLTPENASMSMFAQDIKACLDSLKIKRAHFIGHAFGNRLARTFATLYPDYVENVVLMASGGNFKMSEEQETTLFNCFNLKLENDVRLKSIQRSFFAKGNDASVWLNGWYPDLAKAQILAGSMINGDFFKKAGGKPILLVQAREDYIAPPDKAGQVLKRELGEQVSYVEIPNCGHALSSERPNEIAKEIIEYLRREAKRDKKEPAAAELTRQRTMETKLVTGKVQYRVLLPDGYETSGKEYPLMYFLHGGEADDIFLEWYAPVFKRMWAEGSAPEMVVVTPNARRSFYLDSVDGKEKWETLLTTEFLTHLRSEYRVLKDRKQTYVAGMSMGGMGSLRLALKHPDIFGAVTALEPAIEPAFEWKDVKPIDRYWRPDALITSIYGDPPDDRYRQNNPATIVRDHADRVRAAGQWIYFDVGSEDVFEFYKGADFLHNVLREKKIPHEYRYILGADHVGNSVPDRVAGALAFLQRMRQPAKPDPKLDEFRAKVLKAKRDAGLGDK